MAISLIPSRPEIEVNLICAKKCCGMWRGNIISQTSQKFTQILPTLNRLLIHVFPIQEKFKEQYVYITLSRKYILCLALWVTFSETFAKDFCLSVLWNIIHM